MEHLLFARPCANVERRDSCPAQGALVSGTEQQASVSAPWRGDYRNRHNLLGGETPHLEAGDEKERLGQWHKKGRNATGPVEGQYTETSARRRGVMRKGRGVLVLQEVRCKLEETLSGA